MNHCIRCNQPTSNPKFCSRSCSSSINNSTHPRRKVEGLCKTCKVPIKTRSTYCKQCKPVALDYTSITLGDFQSYTYQRNSRIREAARRNYRKSNKPQYCVVCGYDKHFEVCHIKGISSFPSTTPVSVINDLDNLTALCPNHHWELDNGLISNPSGLRSPS